MTQPYSPGEGQGQRILRPHLNPRLHHSICGSLEVVRVPAEVACVFIIQKKGFKINLNKGPMVSQLNLPTASHSLPWLVFFPKCFLVLSPPQVNYAHVTGCPHYVTENRTTQTKQHSSLAVLLSSVLMLACPLHCLHISKLQERTITLSSNNGNNVFAHLHIFAFYSGAHMKLNSKSPTSGNISLFLSYL